MRDRFITGLNDIGFQKIFFDEDHTQLTYQKAVKISLRHEIFLNEQKK